MTILTAVEYIDVEARLKELGLPESNGLMVLPRNFETAKPGDALQYQSTLPDIERLLAKTNLPVAKVPDEIKTEQIEDRDIAWVVPVIYVSYEVINNNPEWAKILFENIVEYLKKRYSEVFENKQVQIDLVKQNLKDKKTGAFTYERYQYKGNGRGIDEFRRSIEEMHKELMMNWLVYKGG